MSIFKSSIISKIVAIICCITAVMFVMSGCGDKDKKDDKKDDKVASDTVETEDTTAAVPTVENVTTPYSIDGAMPKTEAVDGSYFDDAVFVGDSVSLKLKYYEASEDVLGKAQFLTEGSLSADNLLQPLDAADTVHVQIDGTPMNLDDAIAQIGAKKMYIMLGMNDVGLGIDYGIENYTKLLKSVHDKCPDVAIIVQSVTPCYLPDGYGVITNDKIQEYNQRILKICQDNGYYFMDVASIMFGDNGCLKEEYCSDPEDMGMHFTEAGCAAWVDYLKTHAV